MFQNIQFESDEQIKKFLNIYNKPENHKYVYLEEVGYSYYEVSREYCRRIRMENVE